MSSAGRACEAIAQSGVSPMGPPHGLGRLHAARGEHELAVPQLQAAYEMQRSAGLWRTMVMGSARAALALSLVALGRRAGAAAASAEAERDAPGGWKRG